MTETQNKEEWPWKGARDVCWYCGGKLIWQNDFDYGDVHGEGEGIVTFLHCTKCGAEVQYSLRQDDN